MKPTHVTLARRAACGWCSLAVLGSALFVASTAATAAPAGTASERAPAAVVQPAAARATLADFGGVSAAWDVKHLANWIAHTRDHQGRAFVIIDKRNARLYVFDPQARLKSDSPVLLGKAVGDDTAPGVGNKTLAQLKEEEKTTPAGRFLVERGVNAEGHDVLWIDYDAAVSMHRMREVAPGERRAERMATRDVSDNRISNGCVNVPPPFYDKVLKPTVLRHGAFVYVLPETRPPQELFGSFDVQKPATQRKQA